MNKAVLILAIFAFCLTPALSSNMRGGEDRELASKTLGTPIKLGNIGDIIGEIIGAIKNSTNNNNSTNDNSTGNNSTSPSTPPANNTNNNTSPSNSTNNNTSPSNSTNNNTDSNPSTPSNPTNNTTNNTSPSNSTNNNTSPSNSTNEDTNTTTPTTPPVNNNWYARNDVDRAAFKDKCLVIHNILRQAVGVPDLVWSDSLAASAQAWAENMAANGFRHSGRTGENIASTTYSTKVLIRLLGLWTKEQDWFIKGCKYPKCSSNGKEVGHYTQMVWAKTTQVGCGFAPGVNKQWNYLCCQYYRAGNVIGQYVYPYTAPAN